MIRWFRMLGLWVQIVLAALVVLLVFSFVQFGAPALEADFQVPEEWIQRHQQAQTFEAALDGETVDEFKELGLFDILGLDIVGQLIGLLSVAIFTLHRGGFENYSGRERIANVLIGILLIAGLVPLITSIGKTSFWALPFWAGVFVLLAIGVPWLGRWCAKLLSAHSES